MEITGLVLQENRHKDFDKNNDLWSLANYVRDLLLPKYDTMRIRPIRGSLKNANKKHGGTGTFMSTNIDPPDMHGLYTIAIKIKFSGVEIEIGRCYGTWTWESFETIDFANPKFEEFIFNGG